MTNFVPEGHDFEQPIPGVGSRLDFNLTHEDSINGVFVEITADATVAAVTPTANGGVQQVDKLEFPALAGATAGDYVVLEDTNGLTWAVALDTTGADPAPVGAIYTAVNAARKVQCDISGVVTNVQVAAAVEASLNGLAGFNAVFTTNDTAADGTMLVTGVARGIVANPDPHNADDTGVGTITTTAITAGKTAGIDATADTLTLTTDPGWLTGKSVVLTTSGGAPTGLASGTTYYLIRTGAGVYQFATSLANALAGTDIDITDQGDADSTLTLTANIGSMNCYIFNSIDKLTDAELTSAIASNEFYDVNAGTDKAYFVAQAGFDFSTFTTNRMFIKPSETFEGFTLPDELLPHITLRLDSTDIKITNVQVTHRGIK